MRLAVLPALLSFFLPLAAHAADPAMPEPLQELVKQGAEVRYLGNDNGLDGWVTFRNGQEQYFYATPDRQAILLGVLFNNKGDVVTARQIEALRKKDPSVDKLAASETAPTEAPPPAAAPNSAVALPADAAPVASAPVGTSPAKPASEKAQQIFADFEKSNWISIGQKTAPAIYTIIDPQCPHCHDMIQDVRKSGLLEKGRLQMRLIPVGLMDENSLKQSANLLASANPAAALFKHLDGDKTALLADKDPNTQGVQRNIAMMQTWKLDVTPFTIYKNKTGEIKILRGRPNNLTALVDDLK